MLTRFTLEMVRMVELAFVLDVAVGVDAGLAFVTRVKGGQFGLDFVVTLLTVGADGIRLSGRRNSGDLPVLISLECGTVGQRLATGTAHEARRVPTMVNGFDDPSFEDELV